MKRLVVLGAGESGVGAALLGKKEGYDVFVSDMGIIAPNFKQELELAGIVYEEKNHSIDEILKAEIVVKSPGIPKKAAILKEIASKNIPVISEIEWASRFTKAKIIALTGSNGKTTTTSLIFHILENEGLNVALGGNIGISFARLVAQNNHDYYVLEISSFQLDDIQTFKPFIAIILNITIDHLDQYENKFDLYARSKFKITQNQDNEDFLVYNLDNEPIVDLLQEIGTKANAIAYSTEKTLENGAFISGEKLKVKLEKEPEFQMPLSSLSLLGKHNQSNSLAAATVANILKLKDKKLIEALSDFKAVEHRLEKVCMVAGVQYINDSKATNVNAVYYALECMDKEVIWIAGGTDKGNDYTEIEELVKKKVKALICLGVDNQKLLSTFSGMVEEITEAKSMKEAVEKAYKMAKKDQIVLLSPACASFDLFKNYMDRGVQFKQEVKKL